MTKKFTTILLLLITTLVTRAQTVPNLWGTTSWGGISGTGGTVYKINGDGTGYQTVQSLAALSEPEGDLVPFSDGNLYGVTPMGGANAYGSIYSINPTDSVYTDIYDFNDVLPGCWQPYGNMVAVNGLLYGQTLFGDTGADGALFSFEPVSKTLNLIHSLTLSTGDGAGYVLTPGGNGIFYGIMTNGGPNDDGVLFSLDINHSNKYTILYAFTDFYFGSQTYDYGIEPCNKVIIYNNILYGVTSFGGSNNFGVIYSFDPSTSTYTDLYDFDGMHGGNSYSGLTNVNGIFYGMTKIGGGNNDGVLFSFNVSTNTYSELFDFNLTANGTNPTGDLLLASDSNLYGTTPDGGYGHGVVFKYDISDSTYTVLHNFGLTPNDGQIPASGLIDLNQISTSVNQLSVNREQLSVYPNPTSGQLSVNSYQLPIDKITITNMLGQVIYKSPLGDLGVKQANIDIKDEGLYFVTITSGNKTETQKVVVTK